MNVKNNKIFVTGASGNIGKYLVNRLFKSGFKVIVLTRNSTCMFNKGIKVIVADICEIDKYKKIMCDCRYVFHLAAYQNIFDKNYKEFKKVNIEGTKVILDALKKSKIEKMFYISTTMVLDRIDMSNNYVRSKYEALNFVKNSNIPWIVLYPSIVVDLTIKNKNKILDFLTDGIPGGLMMRLCNPNKIFYFIWIDKLIEQMFELISKGIVHKDYVLRGKKYTASEYLKEAYRRKGKLYIPWRIPLF